MAPMIRGIFCLWELVAVYSQYDSAAAAVVPVLAQIDPLPRPQIQFSIRDGYTH